VRYRHKRYYKKMIIAKLNMGNTWWKVHRKKI
jgi:hypothetical protein